MLLLRASALPARAGAVQTERAEAAEGSKVENSLLGSAAGHAPLERLLEPPFCGYLAAGIGGFPVQRSAGRRNDVVRIVANQAPPDAVRPQGDIMTCSFSPPIRPRLSSRTSHFVLPKQWASLRKAEAQERETASA